MKRYQIVLSRSDEGGKMDGLYDNVGCRLRFCDAQEILLKDLMQVDEELRNILEKNPKIKSLVTKITLYDDKRI